MPLTYPIKVDEGHFVARATIAGGPANQCFEYCVSIMTGAAQYAL